MGHPRALLDRIAAEVALSWPAARGYRMEFERPLPGVRGMLPDIQVVDELGTVHCVVEIGYTRPEKLTYYRTAGIGDIRWYGKDGVLHRAVGYRPTYRRLPVPRPAPKVKRRPLSPRQKEVLAYLREYIAAYGEAPTITEIGEHLGVSSLATVHKHLATLTAKGAIMRKWNHTRAIEVCAGSPPTTSRRPSVNWDWLHSEKAKERAAKNPELAAALTRAGAIA